MARTLLQLVQDFSITQGIPKPTAVVSSTDETVLQIWGLLNDEVMELGERADWTWLRTKFTFTHANGTDYLALALSSLAGYKRIIPQTLWNTTTNLPLNGPIPAAVWRQLITLNAAGAMENFRLYAGGLYIFPYIAAQSYSGEYQSTYAVLASDNTTTKGTFTDDADTPRLPDRIVYAGLRWRWKAAKGQAYAEEMRTYEIMVAAEMNGEEAPGELRMDNPDPDDRLVAPGLLIAAGNWNV